ncbi:ABC transporter ATP-binding protein [Nonomuraea sp. NPDC052265]|uniref:ABC transporter ATP-binding protein n=1 Tax=Nonomuraea sp. NPDC052265 TaxID=3364374 RepID=UPI0037CA9B22
MCCQWAAENRPFGSGWMTNVIEADQITMRYGSVEALHSVNLTVRQGEVFGLLGPNGAGKTTLVEILSGQRSPTGGSVRIFGSDPRQAGPDLRERLGVVPQTTGFEQLLTVREHLMLFVGYYRAPLPVDAVIDLVDLSKSASVRVGRLSEGQRRRLDVALAIIGNPDLIFMDEPTTGFDVMARDRAWELVKLLRTMGKTIILTTHNMDEAQQLADSVGVLFGGRMVGTSTSGSLLAAEQLTTISFRGGQDLLAVLPLHLSQTAQAVDGEILIAVQDSRETLHQLTSWAIDQAVDLHGLEVRRPTLEDAYLKLVNAHDKEIGT